MLICLLSRLVLLWGSIKLTGVEGICPSKTCCSGVFGAYLPCCVAPLPIGQGLRDACKTCSLLLGFTNLTLLSPCLADLAASAVSNRWNSQGSFVAAGPLSRFECAGCDPESSWEAEAHAQGSRGLPLWGGLGWGWPADGLARPMDEGSCVARFHGGSAGPPHTPHSAPQGSANGASISGCVQTICRLPGRKQKCQPAASFCGLLQRHENGPKVRWIGRCNRLRLVTRDSFA